MAAYLLMAAVTPFALSPLQSNYTNSAGCSGTDCDWFSAAYFCRNGRTPFIGWEDHKLDNHNMTITALRLYLPTEIPPKFTDLRKPAVIQVTVSPLETDNSDESSDDYFKGIAYCTIPQANLFRIGNKASHCQEVPISKSTNNFEVIGDSLTQFPCLRLTTSSTSTISLRWEGEIESLVYGPAVSPSVTTDYWLDAPPMKVSAGDFPLFIFKEDQRGLFKLPNFTIRWEETDEKPDFEPYSVQKCVRGEDWFCKVLSCGADSSIGFRGRSDETAVIKSVENPLLPAMHFPKGNGPTHLLPFNGSAALWGAKSSAAVLQWACISLDNMKCNNPIRVKDYSKTISMGEPFTELCWELEINSLSGYLILSMESFFSSDNSMRALINGKEIVRWTDKSKPYYREIIPTGVETVVVQSLTNQLPVVYRGTSIRLDYHFEPFQNIINTFNKNKTNAPEGHVVDFKYLTINCPKSSELFIKWSSSKAFLHMTSLSNITDTVLFDVHSKYSKTIKSTPNVDNIHIPFPKGGGAYFYYFSLIGSATNSLSWFCRPIETVQCTPLRGNEIGITVDATVPEINMCWFMNCGDQRSVISFDRSPGEKNPDSVTTVVYGNTTVVVPPDERPLIEIPTGKQSFVYFRTGPWVPLHFSDLTFSVQCIPELPCRQTSDVWGLENIKGMQSLNFCLEVTCDGTLHVKYFKSWIVGELLANGEEVKDTNEFNNRRTKFTVSGGSERKPWTDKNAVIQINWVCQHYVKPPCFPVTPNNVSVIHVPRAISPLCWSITCPSGGRLSVVSSPYKTWYVPPSMLITLNGNKVEENSFVQLNEGKTSVFDMNASEDKGHFDLLLRCDGQVPNCDQLNAVQEPLFIGCGGVSCFWWCVEVVCPSGESVWHRVVSGDDTYLVNLSQGVFRYLNHTNSISLLVGCNISSPPPGRIPSPSEDHHDCDERGVIQLTQSTFQSWRAISFRKEIEGVTALCFSPIQGDDFENEVTVEFNDIPSGDNWVSAEVLSDAGAEVVVVKGGKNFVIPFKGNATVKVRTVIGSPYFSRGPLVSVRPVLKKKSRDAQQLSAVVDHSGQINSPQECPFTMGNSGEFGCSGDDCFGYCFTILCTKHVTFSWTTYALGSQLLAIVEGSDYVGDDKLPSDVRDLKITHTALWIDFSSTPGITTFKGAIAGRWKCDSSSTNPEVNSTRSPTANSTRIPTANPTRIPITSSPVTPDMNPTETDDDLFFSKMYFIIPISLLLIIIIIITGVYLRTRRGRDREVGERVFVNSQRDSSEMSDLVVAD